MCEMLLIGSYQILMTSIVPKYELITSTWNAGTTLWSIPGDMGDLLFESIATLLLAALGAWILYSAVIGRAV